jgi:hypothetical protein
MLFNDLTFGLFMFPVISFMAVLVATTYILPKLAHFNWPLGRKTKA